MSDEEKPRTKKRGTKAFYKAKGREILQDVYKGSTIQEAAKKAGINRTTASRYMDQILKEEELSRRAELSRSRLGKMLTLCDAGTLKILKDQEMENRGHFVKVSQSIYRTFGILRDEPSIQIANVQPIILKYNDQTIEIGGSSSLGPKRD